MQQHLGDFPRASTRIGCAQIRYEWIQPMSELLRGYRKNVHVVRAQKPFQEFTTNQRMN